MKKNVFLVTMLGVMLAFGLVVVGCDDGNGNGGGGGGDGIPTPNVINGYYGVTNDGKTIEIVITPSVSASIQKSIGGAGSFNLIWATGDTYVAKVDGTVVSRGTVVASGGVISFNTTDGSSVNITGGSIVISASGGTTYSGNIRPAEDYYYCIGAGTDYTQAQITSAFSGKTPEQVYNYCSTTGSSHFDWPETYNGTWAGTKAFGKANSAPDSVVSAVATTLNTRVSAWGYFRHPDGYNVMFYVARVPLF